MEELLDRLDHEAVLVTANRRQASHLNAAYDARRRAAGDRVWPTPRIMPWGAWLQSLWELWLSGAAAPPPLLLSPVQERALWEDIVGASAEGSGLLQPAAAAERAREAWALLHDYRQPLPDPGAAAGDDAQAFVRWARAFEHQCRHRRWLDGARLPAALSEAVDTGDLEFSEMVYLAGFDEVTPAQQALLTSMRRIGCQVVIAQPKPGPLNAVRVACADALDEIDCAARWTRGLLERGETGRIAIVVADLAGERERVRRILDDVLNPGSVLPAAARHPCYNMSLGRPLSEHAIVDTALAVLELGRWRGAGGMDTERLGALLRSPFLRGSEEEIGGRALLDARLREVGELQVRVDALLFHARQGRLACPQLSANLEAWRARCRELPASASAAHWADNCADLLRTVGWAEGRSLDSDEFQAMEAWRGVLSQLASLDEITGRLSYDQAVGRLRQLASRTLFQPRTPELPVQILGILEAAGLEFDHLWIAGWSDEAWPPAPRPNPYLPVALQRRCAMPHGSAERELAFARRVTDRLLAAAPDVVVSWPGRALDRLLQPSPLIAELPVTASAVIPTGHVALIELTRASAVLEARRDEPVPLRSAVPARGGSAILKEQAACPFRAFARFRLGAEPLGSPHTGLDAPARGSLVHRALEYLWADIPGHAALEELDEGARGERIGLAVERALEEAWRLRPAVFTERFGAVERERLTRLLRDWLEVEAARAPFEVVAPEQDRHVEIGGLQLRTRIDRIDRLADGRRIIVDYKTGKTQVGQWLGERPDEPQLPLYAISEHQPLAAVAFAELRAGACAFKGLAAEDGLLPGVKARIRGVPQRSWGEMLEEWRTALGRLARSYRDGEAAVDPKRGAQTCRHCTLPCLCRIAGLVTVDDSEAEND